MDLIPFAMATATHATTCALVMLCGSSCSIKPYSNTWQLYHRQHSALPLVRLPL